MGVLYAILAVLFIALSLTYPATAANAGPNDPDMSQSFSPNAPGEGQYSTLTYTLTNDTGNAKTDLSFTNTFPAGVTVFETRTNSDCPFGATGSIDAVQGNNYITWSGRMGATLTSCTVTVKVIAGPGTYNNNTAAFAVTNLNAPSNAQLKVSPNWGTCPTAAYLFQNTFADTSAPSDVIRVNLVTGTSDSYDQTAPYMNAVGFNELDNYIWGWNRSTNTLARVNGDFTVTNFPTSSLQGNQNLIHADGYLLGDVNQNGILMLAATPDRHNQFVRIDLTTSPPTIVDGGTRDTNPYFMADWAQVGGSGPYWGVGRPTDDAPSYRLYSTDNDGITTNYGIVSGLSGENRSFGAVYAVDDYLYLSNNDSGNIYRINTDGPSLTAEFIATGPEANGNDGARCASAVLDIDWADTPNSYNTRLGADGPRSEISPDLIMGDDISAEDNGQPGPAANLDTYDDGVRLVGGTFGDNPLSVVQGGAMTVEVQVTNSTLQQARLAGWIDRNNDGAFVNNERVVITIPASSGQAIYTLALPALDGSVTGTTYARFRLIPYDEEPVRPDGPVAIGEVEDYAVAIADPPAPTLTVQKSLPSGRVNVGDQFTLSAVGGAVNASVTTSGSATGLQGAVVGPVNVATGTSYTVSESASATTNLSQYSSSYSCVDTSNSAAVASGVGTSVTFTMPSGTNVPNVVCTFTNTPGAATVTLQKNVVARALSGDVFGLGISGGSVSASASASTPATGIQNQTATATLVPGTTYTFTESAQGTTVLANYTTTYSCAAATAPGTPVVSGTGTSFNYTPTPAQALTCTFTNTPIEPRLTLRKNVVERALVGDQFTLSITGGSVSGATATTTGTSTGVQAAVVQSVQVASGTSYQLSETASGTTDFADYASTYVCVDAANFNAVVLPQATGVTFSITPAYGQDIVCTFTNTPIEPELSQLTVVKDVTGRVLAGDQFTLTATGSGLSAPSNTATTSGTAIGEQANRVGPLTVSPNLDYTVTETAAGTTDLAFYDASWECVDANDGDAVVGSGDGTTGSFTMPEGADVTCTFTNDPIYPEVSLSKTSQTAVAERGGLIDFEVVYSNTGSVHANGYAVSDPIPAGLTNLTWSCVAAGGAVCPNLTGTGAILETIATFPAGGSVTYSIDATVAEDAPAEIVNVVSVNIPECLVDGVPADPCETTVTVPVAPELTVVKVLDGRVTATDQFTLTATGGALSGASVTTTGTATGTQPDVLGPLVVVAGTTYTVSESAAGTTDLGSYESTWSCVEASDDTVIASGTGTSGDVEIPTSAATAADIICTFTNELIIYPEVSLSKTSETAVAVRGGAIDFEVVYSNTGSVHANGYAVSDPIPAGLTNLTWSCVAAGGAVCPNLTGAGAILETIATFPAGGSVTYSIDATVTEDAPAEIVNVVSVNIPECLVDGEPADPCETTVIVPVAPELTVVKVLDGRVTATDQFTLTATGGALSGASVTTTGTATGTQPDVLGPLVVVAGTTYTVSESAAGTTDLDFYSSSWSCVEASDDDTVIASGTGTSGDVEIPASATTAADVICTFTNELITPQISLDKSTTTTDAVPGGTAEYTITVTNTGEVAASGFTISDPIPAGITAFSWTCEATGGAVCPTASGTGAISATVATFPAGSSLVYSISATISSTPPPTITNVGSITDPPECLVDDLPADPCEEIVILDVLPRLTLQKDVVSRSFDSDQFTLTASGGALSGPSTTATTTGTSTGLQGAVVGPLKVANNTEYFITEAGAGVTDMDFYDTTWSCVNESDSNVVVASGTGQSGAVTIPTSLAWSADIVCVFTNTAIQPEIELDKSTASVTLLPGGTVNYTLTVTNTGSVHANGIVVSDPIPTGLTAFSWTCEATGGAVCATASGTGAINQSIATFPAGGSIEYSITATVGDVPPRTITNVGGVTFPPTLPPDPICIVDGVPADPCEDEVPNPVSPLLTVEKDVLGRVLAGDQFTLTASGGALAGPSTTATTAGAATGTQAQVVGPLAVDTSTEYGIAEAASGTTDLDFYDTAWECVDTANGDAIVASGTGITGTVTIPTAGSLAPQVVCAFTNDPIYPSIGLTKTTTSTSVDANGTIDYTVTLTNSGAVHANGTTIEDPIPAGLTAFSWTCNATGGAVCPAASGTGAIDATVATFPAGGSLVYSIEATVSSSPPSVITNTATAIPPTGATCTPGNTEPPCVATVTVSPTPVISITKSSNVDYVVPSGEVVYTVLVSNAGSVNANGTVVADARPAGIDSMTWTCAASGGAVCPNASGTGAISETVATFPVGSSLTYTVTAQVSDEPPAEIENVATATPPTGGCAPSNSEPPCIAIVVDPSVPVVAITKSADVEKAVPGDTIVYTVTASNVGPVPASGSVVADAVPAGLTDVAWTCAATAGAVCPNASGTGAISETIATFPAGSTVVYTVTATVVEVPPASIRNVATLTPPPIGLCAPGNTEPPCVAIVVTPVPPTVSIDKTANREMVAAGETIVYTVIAANTGTSSANGAIVSDPIAAGLVSYTWSCVATGGAACAHASGTGALLETIPVFPAGSTVTFRIEAVAGTAMIPLITNVVTITPPPGGSCTADGSANPCDDDVTVFGTLLAATGSVVTSPITPIVLVALGGVLLLIAARRRRARA